MPWSTPATLFLTFRFATFADQKSIWATPDDPSFRFNGLTNQAAPPPYDWEITDVGFTSSHNTDVPLNAFRAIAVRYGHAGNVITQTGGSAAVTQVHAVPAGNRLGFQLASRGNGFGWSNIGVANCLLYLSDLSDADVASTLAYLAARYGVP